MSELPEGHCSRPAWEIQPIHLAASSGKIQILTLLLGNANIDPWVADENGWQLLHRAAVHGHAQAITLLLNDPQVDPTAYDKEGRMITHIAAMHGKLGALRLLAQVSRIDVHGAVYYQGHTPLYVAII
jgi:ankyrin repeat protein